MPLARACEAALRSRASTIGRHRPRHDQPGNTWGVNSGTVGEREQCHPPVRDQVPSATDVSEMAMRDGGVILQHATFNRAVGADGGSANDGAPSSA
jgi:hypothetical protein